MESETSFFLDRLLDLLLFAVIIRPLGALVVRVTIDFVTVDDVVVVELFVGMFLHKDLSEMVGGNYGRAPLIPLH
jgi:hypothetical protein